MKNRTEIFDELHELSPDLAAISNVNVFEVPDGYFDSLTGDILSAITLEKLDLNAKPAFEASVPENYFEGLAASIMGRIKTEAAVLSPMAETSSISEVVAAIGNDNVFTVPPAYFENVPDFIVENLPKPAKVVRMQPRTAWKYAAAAAVAGVLALGAYIWQPESAGENQIAQATQEDKEIILQADSIMSNNAFDATLNSISSEEIEDYLRSQGTDVGAALVASTTEHENLPSELDYLIDEATLINYLKDEKIINNN